MKKIVSAWLIACASLSLAVAGSFWLAEHVFFDRLFYQKSWLHGYEFGLLLNEGMEDQWSYPQQLIFTQRQTDLKLLLEEIKEPTLSTYCPDTSTVRRSYSKQQPLKIAVIGDSNAYGMGVRTSQRFGDQLEQQLNQYLPTKVYTLAEPGNDLIDMFSLYALAKDFLQVDYVVFGVLENDFMINNDMRYPNSKLIRSSLTTLCGSPDYDKEVNFASWSETLASYYPLYSPQAPNYCFVTTTLASLQNDQQMVFIRYFNFNQPLLCARDSKNSNYCLHKFMTTTYSEMITHYNQSIIGLDPTIQLQAVSELEGHPSAYQHQQLATLLSSHIIGTFVNRIINY